MDWSLGYVLDMPVVRDLDWKLAQAPSSAVVPSSYVDLVFPRNVCL